MVAEKGVKVYSPSVSSLNKCLNKQIYQTYVSGHILLALMQPFNGIIKTNFLDLE